MDKPNLPVMPSSLTSTFHESTGVSVKDADFVTSGHDTNITVQNNYNIGVFTDVGDFLRIAARYLGAWTRSVGGKERDPVEITDIIPQDPSSLPVLSIADRYTRSILECTVGYPLYEPEPFSEFSAEYVRQGVNVGDVGFVRGDGSFDFLFNICPPQNQSVNPRDLPHGSSLPEHSRLKTVRPFPPDHCLLSSSVTKTQLGEYICNGPEGAVLVLPEGTVQEEAINQGPFEELAKRHGVDWYEYAKTLGRSIPNGSLYLVTSYIKCSRWGIAVFNRSCGAGQGLTLAYSPLRWKGSNAFATRVADPNKGNIPNQCVFLRGYKIMIRQDIFDRLPTRQRASRIRGGGGSDLFSLSGIKNSLTRTKSKNLEKAVPQTNVDSPLPHPSDFINAELLRQNPGATVAITHDDVWCDLLRDHFPTMNYAKLVNIARSYTSAVDEYGHISLQKISSSTSVQYEKGPALGPPSVDRSTSDKSEKPHARSDKDVHSKEARGSKYNAPGIRTSVDRSPREARVEDNKTVPNPILTSPTRIADMSLGSTSSPVAAIQAILYDYPFSACVLRELLQNSDGAGATKQIFVLDKDSSALMAYNNSQFSENDWQAIQRIHIPTKTDSPRKIGKYGVGFRACYHITDRPQILSGPFFALFDPLNSKGSKIGYEDFTSTEYCKHFDFFASLSKPNSFPGTAIRLPLRTSRSELNQRIIRFDELHRMITDYISEELNMSLLFLDKLQKIEIWETGNGKKSRLASWTKSRTSSSRPDPSLPLVTCNSVFSDGDTEYSWRIIRTQIPKNDAIGRLSQMFRSDTVNYIAQKHELRPDVQIAYPLTSGKRMSGRLFTVLPLPSRTGFPVHIHALFALTSSRQMLRNPNEKGIVQGSEDDVLIKWNMLLFNVYIPQGWSYLLKTLAEDASCGDIFEAWPPRYSSPTSGDAVYWQNILSNTFKVVTRLELRVWPKVFAQGKISYIDLKSSLIVGQSQVNADILAVLAELGLTIVQLPQRLLDLIDDSITQLTPTTAHGKLQGVLDRFVQISANQKALVCKYLLSDNDISNIFGLPLIPALNGSLVALDDRNKSSQSFVALTKEETRIFGTSSRHAISLGQVSPGMARLIREQGTSRANVDMLDPPHLIKYLSSGRRFLNDEWLIEFWCWLCEWNFKTELLHLLRQNSDLNLIPTTKGPQPVSFPIFHQAQETGAGNNQLFEKLGLAFVTSALPTTVIHLLLNHNILKDANNLNHILNAVNPTFVPALTDDEAESIFHSVSSYCGTIPADNLENLKRLPIFPLLVPSDTPRLPPGSNSFVSWSRIDGIEVKGVSPIQLIPSVGDMRYLSGSSIKYSSCSVLKQLNIPVLKEDGVLLQAISHLTSQPKPLQATFVSYIRSNQNRLPIVILTLRRTAFLQATDGSFQSPQRVIDPNSSLAGLFSQGCRDSRVPIYKRTPDLQLFHELQSLNLMKTKLDAYLMQERISYISSISGSSEAIAIAYSLVTLMNGPGFSCEGLSIDPNMCWLPTAHGLVTSKKCINSGRRDTDLFDQVLFSLDGSISISPSFKELLDWDKPVPFDIVKEQFHRTLDSQLLKVQRQKVCNIIRELAGRRLRNSDIQDIQTMIGGRPWVPTKSGLLVPHSHAVFGNVNTRSGFHEVAFSKTEEEIYQFLCRMGCIDQLTTTTIIAALERLQEQSKIDVTVAQRAILLLDMLPDSMTDEEYQSVLVPDESGCLIPLTSEIYYQNKLGSRKPRADERETSIAHHLVTEALAKKLRMNRFGVEVEDGISLGGNPITIIRNTLNRYDPQQFFTEFITNASDAKAKYFSFLIDDHEGPTDRLISEGMKVFQSASLVVHNDSVFTRDDFECIQMMGSRRGKSKVDEYAGVGALSMFHFTELAMIVSGGYVMFLNPAIQSLGYQGRNSILFSLQDSKRLIPDHFEPLNGLFGFDLDLTEPYQGTIFRLPLRNPSHLTNDPVSVRCWPVKEIENMLLKQFDDLTYKSLLFTGLDRINILARRGSRPKTLRSIEVVRVSDNYAPGALFKYEIITFKGMNVQKEWFVLSQPIQIPREFEKLLEKRYKKGRIVPIQVAAALNGVQELGAGHNLFCVLPLSGAVPFPVHISAPFVLEKGKRDIRLSNMGTESEFNRWLLSSEIPRLYLYLLEMLLKKQGTNTAWWPPARLRMNNTHTKPSQVIVEAFWSPNILGDSSKQIFVSRKEPTTLLAPRDIVALVRNQNFFDVISRILDASNVVNVVEFPTEMWEDVNGSNLRIVDSSFLKPLLEDPQVCQRLNRNEDKYTALLLLCSDKASLHKLSLLPLEDGSFATILLQGCLDRLYYVLQQAPGVAYPPFPRNRLISRDFESFLSKSGQLGVIAWKYLLRNYNVSLLSEDGIVELIEDRIGPTDEFVGDKDHHIWVNAFWNAQLKVSRAVSFFPLVPTRIPLHYISLQKVADPSVIVLEAEPSKQQSHYSVLQSLGLVVVVRQALPLNLQEILPTKRLGSYATFLDFVQKNPEKMGVLRQLRADEQGVLGTWIRANFSRTPEDLEDIASKLPVWPVQQAGKDARLAAISEDDVNVLPISMPTSLLRLFSDQPLVDWDDCMKSTKKGPCTAQHILGLLGVSAGSVLRNPERAAYKEFVQRFITIDRIGDQRLLVPNVQSVLQRTDDLYEHSELFIVTFKEDSPLLLSQDFQDLAQALERYGLKRQRQLDLSMFIECAKVFDIERDGSIKRARTRAAVLYQNFNALRLSSRDSERCSELDHLKFIPRGNVRRPGYGNIDTLEYMAEHLQSLLSPSQITISEFEAVCWSQKGQANSPPNPALCSIYRTLGRPSGAEVLAHLAVLSEMAQEHGRHSGLLSDLRATYKWLNYYAHDIAGVISQKKKEKLFLNVDDPESDDWTWHRASNLVIDLEDVCDMHDVKGFLRKYDELLKVAGVRKVKKKRIAEVIPTTDKTRDGFNNMRQSGFNTDVIFKARDNQYQILPAHKNWLAASNSHFSTTFVKSGMKESRSNEPIRIDHSSMCVKGVIDWFYVGKLPDLLMNGKNNGEMRLELAFEMLALADEWEVTDLHERLQVFIINDKDFINPYSIIYIQQQAEATRARRLYEYCQRYEEENRSIIDDCTDENTEDYFSSVGDA